MAGSFKFMNPGSPKDIYGNQPIIQSWRDIVAEPTMHIS
jgi:hypothetical protein